MEPMKGEIKAGVVVMIIKIPGEVNRPNVPAVIKKFFHDCLWHVGVVKGHPSDVFSPGSLPHSGAGFMTGWIVDGAEYSPTMETIVGPYRAIVSWPTECLMPLNQPGDEEDSEEDKERKRQREWYGEGLTN